MNKLRNLWCALPHQVQALLIAFGTAAGTTLVHAISEGDCFATACLKHYIATAISAGLIAARAFYMLPSKAPQPIGPA